MLTINSTIPDFTLDAYHKNEINKISLSDYNGKWLVLLFYPADFTFVCPTELEEAAKLYSQFTDLDAEIISVSTDTAFVHKAWHDHSKAIGKIQYPMLADPSGVMCRAFGTYIEEEGLSQRASMIINPEQEVVAIDIHSNDIGRNTEEILRKLAAAKHVADNDGAIVCPASWNPGDDTLTPGVDLIGKI